MPAYLIRHYKNEPTIVNYLRFFIKDGTNFSIEWKTEGGSVRETHRVRSICEGKASKSEARRASAPSISTHLADCSSPEKKQYDNNR